MAAAIQAAVTEEEKASTRAAVKEEVTAAAQAAVKEGEKVAAQAHQLDEYSRIRNFCPSVSSPSTVQV